MIGLRTLAETTRARPWLADMNVSLKLTALLSTAVLVVLIDSPWTLGALLACVVVLYVFAGLDAAKVRMVLFVAMLTVWGTMFSQALFYASVPRTVLFTIVPRDFPLLGEWTGGLYVYTEGALYGAVQSLRIVTMVGLGLLLCWTTDASAFLSGLVRLKVPYGVAFMTVTALRFLPVVVSEAGVVMSVRRMKGFGRRRGRLWHPWRGFAQVLKPIFAGAIRRSRALAVSAESRAFDPSRERTSARRARGGAKVTAACAGIIAVVLAAIAMKTLHWMFLQEVYYSHHLWWLYDFVRSYL